MQIKKLFPVNEYILAGILPSLLNKANLLRNKLDETLLYNIWTCTFANQKNRTLKLATSALIQGNSHLRPGQKQLSVESEQAEKCAEPERNNSLIFYKDRLEVNPQIPWYNIFIYSIYLSFRYWVNWTVNYCFCSSVWVQVFSILWWNFQKLEIVSQVSS